MSCGPDHKALPTLPDMTAYAVCLLQPGAQLVVAPWTSGRSRCACPSRGWWIR